MVSVDKAVIARLKKNGRTFEILVDCEKAMEFRKGKQISMRDILAVERIFKDARKGEAASGLMETFGTDDVEKIAAEIIKEGEIQLTAEYRRKIAEEIRRKIVEHIVRNAMDARTKKPIPPQRVELALEEVGFKPNPFKSFEEQLKEAVEALRKVLPLSFEKKRVEFVIPSTFAAKCYGIVKPFLTKEEWLNDGSLRCILEAPAGIINEIYDKLAKATKGNITTIER